jgi:hypothetical protein
MNKAMVEKKYKAKFCVCVYSNKKHHPKKINSQNASGKTKIKNVLETYLSVIKEYKDFI